ncbi:MAG: polyamine ABC transporter substrate-binding protein [Rhodobacterales bacterium]|nr:polyamine ABC transporter substrate-binding protein [Rhodobacterales bacterium]NCT11916.1 polyamine ABC transporter substrate-binding protein [Rhodobacterales bacterium]
MKHSTWLGAASLTVLATMSMAQDGGLLVLDYPGFDNPAFHASYVEKHGASPTFSFFSDEEEAFQKVRSGFRADVAEICSGSVPKWTQSGIIQPWDTSRIEEFANLNSELSGNEIGAESEEVYFIPFYFGSTAIAYNPDEVPAEDVASLNVFLNPKYAQRMTLPDNVDDAFALAYLATGVTDWTDVTDDQFNAAADWLRAAHVNMRTYWSDPAELAQLMSSGEILVSWAWNETFPTMVEEGRPIAYQREAAEGSSVWLCGYVNMANGQGDEDKAYDYLNAVLAPSSTLPLLASGFGHANAAALDAVPEEDLAASGLGHTEASLLAQLPISIAMRERHAETFELIKAGF